MSSTSPGAQRLSDVHAYVFERLQLPQDQFTFTMSSLLRTSSNRESNAQLALWPACADFLAPRLKLPSGDDAEAQRITVASFLLEKHTHVQALLHAIDGIMVDFFGNTPQTRERIARIRQDVSQSNYDSHIIYTAYLYFLQENLLPFAPIELQDMAFKKNIGKIGWYLYLVAKCELLAQSNFASLDCTFLFHSIMLILSDWAAQFFPLPSADSNTPLPPRLHVYDRLVPLPPIESVFNDELHSWLAFHHDVFLPFASEHIAPLLPSPNLIQTEKGAAKADSLGSIRRVIATFKTNVKKLLSETPLEHLEYDEKQYWKDGPVEDFYPDTVEGIQRTMIRDEMGRLVPRSKSCFQAMHIVRSQLAKIHWMHQYVLTPASTEVVKLVKGLSEKALEPADLNMRILAAIVSESRIEVIKGRLSEWRVQIERDTKMFGYQLDLLESFYWKMLLDSLLGDCEQHRTTRSGIVELRSPVAESDNFVATLFAVVFEIAMFCFERADSSSNAFPYILGVTEVQSMDFCKLVSSVSKLMAPIANPSVFSSGAGGTRAQINPMPPASVFQNCSIIEEKAITEHVWRPGSPIYAAYNSTTKSLFFYALITAGPPHAPRSAVPTVLCAPGLIDKFYTTWCDSSAAKPIMPSNNEKLAVGSGLKASSSSSSTTGTTLSTATVLSVTPSTTIANSSLMLPNGDSGINYDAYQTLHKLLRLGCNRIRSICKMIPELATKTTIILQTELAFCHIVTQRLDMLMGRHMDTIVVATICAIVSLVLDATNVLPVLTESYCKLLTPQDAALNHIPTTFANDPTKVHYLNIHEFYVSVFEPELSTLFSKFKKSESGRLSPSYGRKSPSMGLLERNAMPNSSSPNQPTATGATLQEPQGVSTNSVSNSQLPTQGTTSTTLDMSNDSLDRSHLSSPMSPRGGKGKRRLTDLRDQFKDIAIKLDFGDAEMMVSMAPLPSSSAPPSCPSSPALPTTTNSSSSSSSTPRSSTFPNMSPASNGDRISSASRRSVRRLHNGNPPLPSAQAIPSRSRSSGSSEENIAPVPQPRPPARRNKKTTRHTPSSPGPEPRPKRARRYD